MAVIYSNLLSARDMPDLQSPCENIRSDLWKNEMVFLTSWVNEATQKHSDKSVPRQQIYSVNACMEPGPPPTYPYLGSELRSSHRATFDVLLRSVHAHSIEAFITAAQMRSDPVCTSARSGSTGMLPAHLGRLLQASFAGLFTLRAD